MKKLLILLPLVTLMAASCQMAPSSNNSTTNASGTDLTVNSSMQKFSDSADYSNSHLISGDTLDSQAQLALAGFNLNKQTLADGSTQINLTATESGYHDQQYVLKTGQQLYFIDRTLGDDQGTERSTGDDYGVIVDSQGLIVNSGQ